MVQEAYFAAIRDAVARYAGQVEKFIGDAAMAVFGIPKAHDDDMERAVRAGLAICSAIGQIGAGLGLEDGALQVRVGVNTGEIAVSASVNEEWRVTGDAVNVAARLQTAAAPGSVLIGPTTALGVADRFALNPVGALTLKGKSEPLPAWIATDVLPEPSRDRAMGQLHAPMLGREAEMDTLLAALEGARGGPAARWTIVAPPGVGKTRLLTEFAIVAQRARRVDQARQAASRHAFPVFRCGATALECLERGRDEPRRSAPIRAAKPRGRGDARAGGRRRGPRGALHRSSPRARTRQRSRCATRRDVRRLARSARRVQRRGAGLDRRRRSLGRGGSPRLPRPRGHAGERPARPVQRASVDPRDRRRRGSTPTGHPRFRSPSSPLPMRKS